MLYPRRSETKLSRELLNDPTWRDRFKVCVNKITDINS